MIDKIGVRPSPEKFKAIKDMDRPHNQTELRRCLGMITYLGQFINNLSTVVAPLNALLSDGVN